MNSEEGYTLLESLLIAGILAMIALATIPLSRLNEYQKVEAEVACLVSDIHYVQEISKLEKRRNISIPVNERFGTPTLHLDKSKYYVMESTEETQRIVEKHELPRDIYVHLQGNGSWELSFLANGDPATGTMQTVHMRSKHYHRAIIIDQAGRVRVERRDNE